MKFIKKLNRGLIALVLIVLVVAVYLLSVVLPQDSLEDEAEEFCSEYLKMESAYYVLPEQYRDAPSSMPETEFNAYVDKMKTEIKGYFSDKKFAELLTNKIEKILKSQYSDNKPYEFLPEIRKIKFEDAVFVDGNLQFVATAEHFDEKTNEERKLSDYIEVEKIDGVWKVVYSAVNVTSGNDYYDYYSVTYEKEVAA